MPELNIRSTGPTDTTGANGQVQQPFYQTTVAGYNYGGANNPTGDGILEWGSGTPGSLPFQIDQAGNVTTTGTVTSAGSSTGTQVNAANPTGVPATDTANLQAAVTKLAAALAFGPCALVLGNGTYVVNSNAFVIQSLSNWSLLSAGSTSVMQAPNTVALPNNTAGDLCVIADCTNFTIDGIFFDCQRDTVSPLTPLTASAASGQKTVTVASGQGANYVVGQNLSVYGGVGSADTALSDGGNTTALIVSSITPGGGSGGGDLITFNRNLNNTYSVTGGTALSDGFGPYAWTSDYLTPYECYGISNTVAGRTSLKGEDQQNNLHLLNCQLFTITNVTARNSWSSQIKTGTGFSPTSLADGCQQGTISDCTVYHGYDQGVSLWNSLDITVTGCVSNASGWGGIVTFSSNNCTITGNTVIAPVYSTPPNVGNGNGIAIQGGSQCAVVGNTIDSAMQNGIYLLNQGPGVTGEPPTGVTTTAFLEMQTAAGTSIAVSATTVGANTFKVGSQLSIIDSYRTEIVYIASVVDGTHLTFSNALRFSHASGVTIGYSVAEDTVVSGNTVNNSYDNGILNQGVRAVISNNTVLGSSMRNSASNSGIICSSSGWGSSILGNRVGAGRGASMTLWSVDHMLVEGNQITGPAVGTAYAVDLQTFTDSIFTGNRVSDGLSSAIRGGGTSCNRSTFSNNVITRFVGDGIGITSASTGVTITGNSISSCNGTGGINLSGTQYSTISNNVCTGNHASGIQLGNNGSTYCLYNTISHNICREDGSGINVATGAALTQQYGIREQGANSDYNVYIGNEMDGNTNGQLVVVGPHSTIHKNIISGAIIEPTVTTPGISTSAIQNTTGYDVVVYITAVALTAVSVGAVAIGAQPMVYLPAGQTITLTYTGSPTWVWTAAG